MQIQYEVIDPDSPSSPSIPGLQFCGSLASGGCVSGVRLTALRTGGAAVWGFREKWLRSTEYYPHARYSAPWILEPLKTILAVAGKGEGAVDIRAATVYSISGPA